MALPTKAGAQAVREWLACAEAAIASAQAELQKPATRQDINRKLVALATALPPPRGQTSEEARSMLAIYIDGLEDVPEIALSRACRTAVQTSKWFPRVAEMRDWAITEYPPALKATIAKAIRAKELLQAVACCGHSDDERLTDSELAALKRLAQAGMGAGQAMGKAAAGQAMAGPGMAQAGGASA